MFKKTHLRFDEGYVGATYEDSDFCMQHLEAFPEKPIMICNKLRLIHKMEAKGRGSEAKSRDYWAYNRQMFANKWGIKI